jgi:hypothetical protein
VAIREGNILEFLTIGTYIHDLKHVVEFQDILDEHLGWDLIARALLGMPLVLPRKHFSTSCLAAMLLYFLL